MSMTSESSWMSTWCQLRPVVCVCALCAGHMKVQLACQASRLQPSACLMENWTASTEVSESLPLANLRVVMVTTLQWMGPPLPLDLYKVISQSEEGATSAEIAALLHDLVQIPLSCSTSAQNCSSRIIDMCTQECIKKVGHVTILGAHLTLV